MSKEHGLYHIWGTALHDSNAWQNHKQNQTSNGHEWKAKKNSSYRIDLTERKQ